MISSVLKSVLTFLILCDLAGQRGGGLFLADLPASTYRPVGLSKDVTFQCCGCQGKKSAGREGR